ncbi:hypothetical protein [Streptomyces sp. GS7]|uniref:hypothetical protein n=1 Tax=Streptomyces sp. GS7 TaxID=2692234 RepID=UPI0013181A0C|nr:hypothetical protein [Streptomyces sp. GS7]QHC26478.1 hypothetical protein GR130_39050 [Streptomyces sp. GS7]
MKRIALKPPGPGPLPDPDRYGDGQPDPLDSLLGKARRGEVIAAAGGKEEGGDRDPYDEEWRAHDRHGPYGQRRRRRN